MFRSKSFKLLFVAISGFLIMLMVAIPVMAQAPFNDHSGGATEILGLPFSETLDTTEATANDDDPYPNCWWQPVEATVWYQFTATEDMHVMASTIGSDYDTLLGVYQEDIGYLNEIACYAYQGTVDFNVSVGQTYYFMIGDLATGGGPYYPPPNPGGQLEFSFSEYVPLPPIADFYFWPEMPSTYDLIEFYDYSYDPIWVGIETQTWDFGDGSTATGCCPRHQYSQNGEYLGPTGCRHV